MSTAAAPQMTPEDAYNTLHRRVHTPVFFNKLAEFGIKPKSPEEAQEMLKTAGKLRTLYDHNQATKAAATQSGLSKIAAQADSILAQRGLVQPASAVPEVTPTIQKVAHQAAADNELATAVLTLLANQSA